MKSGTRSRIENFLIVVAGATAIGKTELSVQLAKWLNCQIISADSRQFFKELRIGTAKPSEKEMGGIVHHFVDFLSIQEEFSAGKFEFETIKLLPKLFKNDNRVIMTGGSGLYIQAVCDGMNDIPDVDLNFRTQLYEELEIHGLEALLEELKLKDHEYYKLIDRSNPQRVVRALEVCRSTGQPYSIFRSDKKIVRDFKIIKIGLDRPREELFERINQRMDQMIEDGLFDEAKKYREFRHLNALQTVGYKEVFGYLDGSYDMEEAARLLKRNTRRYAKRQLTWFKKDIDFHWFHPDDIAGIKRFIETKMEIHGNVN